MSKEQWRWIRRRARALADWHNPVPFSPRHLRADAVAIAATHWASLRRAEAWGAPACTP